MITSDQPSIRNASAVGRTDTLKNVKARHSTGPDPERKKPGRSGRTTCADRNPAEDAYSSGSSAVLHCPCELNWM
jgi:hypothetical protein